MAALLGILPCPKKLAPLVDQRQAGMQRTAPLQPSGGVAGNYAPSQVSWPSPLLAERRGYAPDGTGAVPGGGCRCGCWVGVYASPGRPQPRSLPLEFDLAAGAGSATPSIVGPAQSKGGRR